MLLLLLPLLLLLMVVVAASWAVAVVVLLLPTAAAAGCCGCVLSYVVTHRLLSSSFWGLPYRIPNMNQKKELLRGLWVNPP